MKHLLAWEEAAAKRFPSLQVCLGAIRNINVARSSGEASALRANVLEKARRGHCIDLLKDNPTVRAYRDLFWSLGIDPTKTRPSGEALLRRALHGEDIPTISTVVDAYNMASLETIIPLSGFDLDKVAPPFLIRFSKSAETFHGIGMKAPVSLEKNLLLLTDAKQILCIYPHRDADASKITLNTKNALIVGYGAPKVTETQLSNTIETALCYIQQVAGGEIDPAKVYSATQQNRR